MQFDEDLLRILEQENFEESLNGVSDNPVTDEVNSLHNKYYKSSKRNCIDYKEMEHSLIHLGKQDLIMLLYLAYKENFVKEQDARINKSPCPRYEKNSMDEVERNSFSQVSDSVSVCSSKKKHTSHSKRSKFYSQDVHVLSDVSSYINSSDTASSYSRFDNESLTCAKGSHDAIKKENINDSNTGGKNFSSLPSSSEVENGAVVINDIHGDSEIFNTENADQRHLLSLSSAIKLPTLDGKISTDSQKHKTTVTEFGQRSLQNSPNSSRLNTITEPIHGIRISHCPFKLDDLQQIMNGLQKLSLSRLSKGNIPDENWISSAVLVRKSLTNTASNSTSFCVWELSDLKGNYLPLYLFSQAYQSYWKTVEFSVVAFSKGKILDKKPGKSSCSVSVSSPSNITVLGTSVDAVYCKAVTKGGQPCKAVVSKTGSGYCQFHVTKAYKFASVKNQRPSLLYTKVKQESSNIRRTSSMIDTLKRKMSIENNTVKLGGLVSNYQGGRYLSASIQKLHKQNKRETAEFGGKALSFNSVIQDLKNSKPQLSKAKYVDFGRTDSPNHESISNSKSTAEPDTENFPSKPGLSEAKKRAIEILKGNGGHSSNAKKLKSETVVKNKIDINSAEFQKVLDMKSSYSWELGLSMLEKQEKLFDEMEEKEKIEEELAQMKERVCHVVSCAICKYTTYKQSEYCKEQKHNVSFHKATQRFFECKACKRRLFVFSRYPKKKCPGCNGTEFIRTTFKKLREGPKLPSEKLLLRGEEIPFLNSLGSYEKLNL